MKKHAQKTSPDSPEAAVQAVPPEHSAPPMTAADSGVSAPIEAPPLTENVTRLIKYAFSQEDPALGIFAPMALNMARRIAPQDPVEELLVVQMLATFYRGTELTRNSNRQINDRWFDLFQCHADRAMNLFRKQMQALADYRRPRKSSFTAIRNANIARQQVVVTSPDPIPTPEPHAWPPLAPAAETKVQADPEGQDRPSRLGPEAPAVET